MTRTDPCALVDALDLPQSVEPIEPALSMVLAATSDDAHVTVHTFNVDVPCDCTPCEDEMELSEMAYQHHFYSTTRKLHCKSKACKGVDVATWRKHVCPEESETSIVGWMFDMLNAGLLLEGRMQYLEHEVTDFDNVCKVNPFFNGQSDKCIRVHLSGYGSREYGCVEVPVFESDKL